MYQRTVLVVDDEPLIRMALADCLVIVTSGGHSAAEIEGERV